MLKQELLEAKLENISKNMITWLVNSRCNIISSGICKSSQAIVRPHHVCIGSTRNMVIMSILQQFDTIPMEHQRISRKPSLGMEDVSM